jgi:hypothetical protein
LQQHEENGFEQQAEQNIFVRKPVADQIQNIFPFRHGIFARGILNFDLADAFFKFDDAKRFEREGDEEN